MREIKRALHFFSLIFLILHHPQSAEASALTDRMHRSSIAHSKKISKSKPVKRARPVPVVHKTPEQKCIAAYRNLYHNQVSDWRVVFGYKDGRPARFVGDRYERAYFVDKLLKMGFERSPDNEDLFTRKVIDPDHHLKNIALTVVASSVGPDDEENARDPFQQWQSNYAEKTYLDGLRSADLVFYDGHSRDGGGPDFRAPRCTSSQHVDYDWYIRHTPGLKKMMSALQERTHHSKLPGPKFIGLFSCVSDKHFSKKIKAMSPSSALVNTNSLIYYADALDALSITLQNLLELKCESNFHPPSTKLSGFFK